MPIDVLKGAAMALQRIAFVGAFVAAATGASAQLTLEIPVEEFEAAEDYEPIPTPDPKVNPIQQMFDSLSFDMRGTLPDAVLEEMLGASPYDFVDVVWGMEVSGSWVDSMGGTGTLQVTNFTEGLGASGRINRERFTGAKGFRMYNAQLATPGNYTFTLSAIFPPDSDGVAFGSELDGARGIFEVTFLCHMFEPDNTGCIDHDDEYFYTEVPVVQNLHVRRRGDNYRMTFVADVPEYHHRSGRHVRGGLLIRPSGRSGHVRGWVCDKASWEEDPVACTGAEPLRIVENSPPNDRENVNPENPRIVVDFSEPIDHASLEENFSLITRSRGGARINVAGRFVSHSDTRYEFEPEEALESGVRYEARVEGGENGVRARGRNGESGSHLNADHWWRFSTLVDLVYHDGYNDAPIEIDVYQTIRNAPLVVGKPTVHRIGVEWEPHAHIDSAWQPTSYPAELELNVISPEQWHVEAQQGGSADGNVVRVVRSDELLGNETRRQAQNTINVYGWTPETAGGSTWIEARLRPHDPYPVPREPQNVIVEREIPHWHVDPGSLVFRYTFLKLGSWEGGVPEAEMQHAMSVVRQAEEFAVQVMPFREVHGIDTNRDADRAYANYHRNTVTALLDAYSTVTGHGRDAANFEALKNTIRKVREDLDGLIGAHEIVVVFYPIDFLGVGWNIDRLLGDNPRRGIGLGITTQASTSSLAMGLVHEFGHHFGLSHRPGHVSEINLPPGAFVDFGIEGFRMAPDGLSGRNKSATEGNAEHPSILVPLMWPQILPTGQVFVSESDYQTFMNVVGNR